MDNDAYVTYHGNTEADREIAKRSVLFIDNETAARVLTMEDTIDAVEESYREWGLGRATATRATHSVPRPGGDGWYTWDPMASALPGMDALAVRMKSDILPPSGTQVKKYCVAPGKFCGLIMLFSTDDGAPLAIMNDGHIQHMRVGAAGAISVKHMAREDAAVLGLYGTAGMATAHALAIARVRPIREIRVYSPNPEHRAAFADRMSENLGVSVVAVDDPRRVMEGADIVAACTNSLAAGGQGGTARTRHARAGGVAQRDRRRRLSPLPSVRVLPDPQDRLSRGRPGVAAGGGLRAYRPGMAAKRGKAACPGEEGLPVRRGPRQLSGESGSGGGHLFRNPGNCHPVRGGGPQGLRRCPRAGGWATSCR